MIDIIDIYWIFSVVAIYANRLYNRKKNHCMSIVEWKIVGMKTSVWRHIAYHVFTVFVEPLLLPVGIPAFLIHRAKEKKENNKLHELVIRTESNLPKDMYYQASVALVNALAYGKFEKLEELLADDVQVLQEGHKTIKGKAVAMRFWRSWKNKHLDTIDFDAFDRIFDDTDFEIVRSKEDSHTCVKLMRTLDEARFELNDGRVAKMVLTDIAREPVIHRDNPDTELHDWPY